MLYDVIQKFQDVTLEFLQMKVPTISKVLPLFKMIQQHLEDLLRDPDLIKDKSGQKYHGLKSGIKVGLDKINIHLEKALVGDYPLLGAGKWPIIYNLIHNWLFVLVLHLSIHLAYFEDTSKWDLSIAKCACMLLEHLYDIYKADFSTSNTTAPKVLPTSTSIFLDVIHNLTPNQQKASITEIKAFFSSTYPCLDGNVLKWWKVNTCYEACLIINADKCFSADTCSWLPHPPIARDILVIPGVSISVKQLFSSSKHTLSDSQSDMTTESASKTVVTKEWLKKGFGVGVNYLDDVGVLTWL